MRPVALALAGAAAAAAAGAGAAAAMEAASRGAAKPEAATGAASPAPWPALAAFCALRLGYIPSAACSLRPAFPALPLRPPLLENDEPLAEAEAEEDEEDGLALIPPLLRPLVVPQKPWAIWTVLELSSSASTSRGDEGETSAESGAAARAKD